MRLLLIANPVSGGDARPRISRAAGWFLARGADVDLKLTAGRGDARRYAAEARGRGYDRIVAAGGDGTLNEVLNGLQGAPLPVAFLPLGTTNVFALETGIPRQLEKACRLALEGTPQAVCLGRAAGEYFLLMASAGFDAAVVHGIDLRLKRRVGKLAYVAGALRILGSDPLPPFTVSGDDGIARPACQVVAGNGRCYGGRFSLTPAASLLAERLDVCVVAPMGKVRFAATVLALLVGATPPGVTRFATRALTLQGAAVPLQIDGDAHGTLPCALTVTAGAAQLVIP